MKARPLLPRRRESAGGFCFVTGITASAGFLRNDQAASEEHPLERGDHTMRADHPEPNQPSVIEFELSDLELDDVVGGGSAKASPANANRFDPYRSFNFRVTFG